MGAEDVVAGTLVVVSDGETSADPAEPNTGADEIPAPGTVLICTYIPVGSVVLTAATRFILDGVPAEFPGSVGALYTPGANGTFDPCVIVILSDMLGLSRLVIATRFLVSKFEGHQRQKWWYD